MDLKTLTAEDVIKIHDEVINPRELQGLARDKSLEGALWRVESRIEYGMIDDAIALAAIYAVAIARGHVFRDANKRTAFKVMRTCLHINGIDIDFFNKKLEWFIIPVAEGKVNEDDFTKWLRRLLNDSWKPPPKQPPPDPVPIAE